MRLTYYRFFFRKFRSNPNSLILKSIYINIILSPFPYSTMNLINQWIDASILPLPLCSLLLDQAITLEKSQQSLVPIFLHSNIDYQDPLPQLPRQPCDPQRQPLSRSTIRHLASSSFYLFSWSIEWSHQTSLSRRPRAPISPLLVSTTESSVHDNPWASMTTPPSLSLTDTLAPHLSSQSPLLSRT